MAKTWKKVAALAVTTLMASTTAIGFSACGKVVDPDLVTYNTYTSVMPSNWNELTYQDNNDTQIMSYIASSFFEFDYKYDKAKGGKFKADGSLNPDAIVSGGYEVKGSAAKGLKDVTADMAEEWGYTADQVAAGGYAWEITLREDLKWDDGTPIDATDFVYTMKQQLDPAFLNYRASTFYSTTNVKGAKLYTFQGQSGHGPGYEYGTTYEENKDSMKFSWSTGYYWNMYKDYGYTPAQLLVALGCNVLGDPDAVDAFLTEWEGKPVAECLADDGDMKTFLEWFMEAAIADWTDDEYDTLLIFFTCDYVYPEYSFDDVGYFSPSKYKLVVCYDESTNALDADGNYTYIAAYNLQSFPLVKKDLYEKCKISPETSGSSLWTSNYNSSLETTASWGPYKLSAFQSGKSYTLEKNPYWYGYSDPEYAGQYLIDKIVCDQIESVETAWMSFLNGTIDDVGLDVTRAADYRNSKYTSFTPSTSTFSIHLFGGLETLKLSGRNNGILAITDFRKAISLGLDREAFNAAVSTANQPAFGYLNSMYYYDVENGGVYRDTVQAKEGLLRAYGYEKTANGWTDGTTNYATLDAAYASLNGYNLAAARDCVRRAYEELTAHPDLYGYDSSKMIQIKYGTSVDNESVQRQFNWLNNMVKTLVETTPLEGKVELVFDASFGSKWSDAFQAGSCELCTGGWSGAAFDPCYLIGAYIEPASAFTATYFDVETEQMTFKMPGNIGDYKGAGVEMTMPILDWFDCLNGDSEAAFDWSEGVIPTDARLELLAKLEEVILTHYYSIPMTSQYSASLLGAQFSHYSNEYNTFMGYGGMQYIRVNYNNKEWNDFVKANKKDLTFEYQKSE